MPCFRHRSLADNPAACSFKTLMICSSVNLPLRIVCLLSGEQNPNLKPGAFQGSRSAVNPVDWRLRCRSLKLGIANQATGWSIVMKKFLLGTVGLLALGMAAPATAADLAARPYTKAPPPMIAPIYDWTGFYIGANGG